MWSFLEIIQFVSDHRMIILPCILAVALAALIWELNDLFKMFRDESTRDD